MPFRGCGVGVVKVVMISMALIVIILALALNRNGRLGVSEYYYNQRERDELDYVCHFYAQGIGEHKPPRNRLWPQATN
jgi:hypothetical protein